MHKSACENKWNFKTLTPLDFQVTRHCFLAHFFKKKIILTIEISKLLIFQDFFWLSLRQS